MNGRAERGWGSEIEQLVGEHYEPLKAEVLATVTGKLRGSHTDRGDLEEAYNTAWHAVCRHVARGEPLENLTGLLVKATYRLALNARRSRKDDRRSDLDIEARAGVFDLAEAAEDRLLLQELFAKLAKRLNEKERKGVVLCLLYGYSRAEAARALGIREPAFEKVMNRARPKLESVIGSIRTRGCDAPEWADAIRSYALGSMPRESPDYERVRAHLEVCGDCKRYVSGLQRLALLPPFGAPLLVLAPKAGGAITRLARLLRPRHALLGSNASRGAGAAAAGTSPVGLGSVVGAGKATIAVVAAVVAGVAVPVLTSHASSHDRRHPPTTPANTAATMQRPEQPAQASKASTHHQQAKHPPPSAPSKRAARRQPRHAEAVNEVESAEREFGFERPPPPSTPASASVQAKPAAPAHRESEALEAEFGLQRRE